MRSGLVTRGCAAVAVMWVTIATAAGSSTITSEDMPRYRPPAQAADPSRVIGGQTRGTNDESLAIAVIAPDHTGLTARAQPTLYWYASRPIAGRVEFTIQDEKASTPLIEAPLRVVERGGLLPIRLSDFGVRLDPEREYRWSIAVVTDDKVRSRDVVTSGFIRRLATQQAPRAGENATQRLFRFADQGLWYDAIEVIGDEIDRNPNDPQLRRQRMALLEQIGLKELVEQEGQRR